MNRRESVVHEYSVLYSNRIIQREKKWNDGIMRYYEFNNKVEVMNGDGHIIETDFVSNKFGNHLHEGKQLRLPSNRILVEIDGKNLKYTRDLSTFFSKERRQLEMSPRKPSLSYYNGLDERNKKRKCCREEAVRAKKEPVDPFIRVKPETRVKEESTDVQKHGALRKNLENTPAKVKTERDGHTEQLKKENAKYPSALFFERAKTNNTRTPTRVLPRSSKIFKHLQKNINAF